MSILHRYIAKTIIQASMIVTLLILGIVFFINLLGELKDIGTGEYSFFQAVTYVLLKLPHDLYLFFPMFMLLGAVLGLGALSSSHELIVMRTSGLSVHKVTGAVVTAAVIVIIFATLLGEGIAPRAMFLAEKHKESAKSNGQAIATATGVWIHEGNNFLHIDQVIGYHHLEGVQRYEFDAHHRLLTAYYVKSMDFEKDQWQFHDLVKTTFLDDKTHSDYIAAGTWDLTLHPSVLHVGIVGPEELSLPKLAKYSRHLVENGLQASTFQYEFWKRIFEPLTTIVMMLLAIPFVFHAPRSTTIGLRILLGVILGFVFYVMNAFLGQVSVVFQIPAWIAAIFPTILFGILGYLLMKRATSLH